ncbi:MAG: type II secretion system F family protein [Candidatus Omnitrophica bacterium]|nr:type II secretion system F family protein [Candidatus Omnitrophota bacterium]
MKRYRYHARDTAGRGLRGEILAFDPNEASGLLQEAGVYVTSIRPESARRRRSFRNPWVFFRGQERFLLLESWAALIRSGFPIQSALTVLGRSIRRPSARRALLEVQERIDRGATLAQALRASRLLPPSWVSLIELGEKRGDYLTPLEQMLRHAQEMDRIKRELGSMLLMPCVVLALGIVWVWVYLGQVVPATLAFVGEVGGSLPPMAAALAAHSQGIVTGALALVLAGLVLALLMLRSSRTDQTMDLIQTWVPSGMPLLGPLVSKMRLIVVCAELRLQLEAGVPIVTAVHALSRSVPHPATRRDLTEVYRQLRDGLPVPEALDALEMIPPVSRALLAAGDCSGQLPDMLNLMVRETALDLTEGLRRLTIVLRNLLVLGTGILVGFLMVSAFILLRQQFEVLLETGGEHPAIREIESYTLLLFSDRLGLKLLSHLF